MTDSTQQIAAALAEAAFDEIEASRMVNKDRLADAFHTVLRKLDVIPTTKESIEREHPMMRLPPYIDPRGYGHEPDDAAIQKHRRDQAELARLEVQRLAAIQYNRKRKELIESQNAQHKADCEQWLRAADAYEKKKVNDSWERLRAELKQGWVPPQGWSPKF